MKRPLALAVILSLWMIAPARALEIQSLVGSDCQRATGIIVFVSETHVDLMDLGGKFQRLPIEKVDSIYTFNILENPFSNLNIDDEALSRLKEIYLDDSDKPRAIAWPVKFIEDLVLFYSLDGKTHVHTLGDIYKLRPAGASQRGLKTLAKNRRFEFEFPELSAKCPVNKTGPAATKPTRILADKISVDEYFNSLHKGYERLNGFQERTYLYAKPFLFEKETRLGIVLGESKAEPQLQFPLYFQWATGEPYQFQSFNVVGSKVYEFGPNSQPVFALRSDVKSHVFHASFVGNVLGIPAGESIFLERENIELKDSVTVQPAFNYIALMGGDFGPYSLSTGFFFPSFGIRVGDEEREVLGSSATYATRFMFTKKYYRVRAIGAFTKYSRDTVSKDDVFARQNGNEAAPPDSYEFKNIFLRGGLDWEFTERIKGSVDAIANRGDYKEVYAGVTNTIEFTKLILQGQVKLTFSDYVSVAGFANLHQHNYEGQFVGVSADKEVRETTFFGTFEFIF